MKARKEKRCKVCGHVLQEYVYQSAGTVSGTITMHTFGSRAWRTCELKKKER